MGAWIRKSLAISTAIIVFILWKSIQNMQPPVGHVVFLRDTIVFPVQNCRRINTSKDSFITSRRIIFFNNTSSIMKRVLILSEKTSLMPGLLPILEGNRIVYDIHYLSDRNRYILPLLTEGDTGKYAAIIFTSFRYYYELSMWNKHLLENYCRAFGVGMILFNQGEPTSTSVNKDAFPFKIYTGALTFKMYHVSANATILRLVKGDNMVDSDSKEPQRSWSIFIPQDGISFHNNFEVIATSSFADNTLEDTIGPIHRTMERFPVIIHDLGKQDKIHKIYFGGGLSFWPHKLLFFDALSFVSHHKLARSLNRWIQVDIDDIFVGRTGIRMKKEDVKASGDIGKYQGYRERSVLVKCPFVGHPLLVF